MNEREYATVTERVARITYLLTGVGIAMTTAEVAKEVGLSHRAALCMLQIISRPTPIYEDEKGIWRKCSS